MSDEKLEAIKRKIEKLLALSESNFEAESKAALTKAYKLMEEYSIEMGALYGNELKTVNIKRDKPLPKWEASMINGIAKSAGVYFVSSNFRSTRAYNEDLNKFVSVGSESRLYFTGRQCDIDNLIYISDILTKKVTNLTKAYAKTAESWLSPGERRSRADSYRKGMARGISIKLQEISKDFFANNEMAKGTAVVPVDTKYSEAQDLYLKDNKVVSYRSTIADASAYMSGTREGKNVTVHKGMNKGESSQALLS